MVAKRSQGSYGVKRGHQIVRADGERQEFELEEGDYQDLLQAVSVNADFQVWQELAERYGFAPLTVIWRGPGTRYFTAREA